MVKNLGGNSFLQLSYIKSVKTKSHLCTGVVKTHCIYGPTLGPVDRCKNNGYRTISFVPRNL